MSSEPRHLSIARKTSRSQGEDPKNIETNLAKLGLLVHEEKRHRSKRKVVEFQSPVSDNKSLSPLSFGVFQPCYCE